MTFVDIGYQEPCSKRQKTVLFALLTTTDNDVVSCFGLKSQKKVAAGLTGSRLSGRKVRRQSLKRGSDPRCMSNSLLGGDLDPSKLFLGRNIEAVRKRCGRLVGAGLHSVWM